MAAGGGGVAVPLSPTVGGGGEAARSSRPISRYAASDQSEGGSSLTLLMAWFNTKDSPAGRTVKSLLV